MKLLFSAFLAAASRLTAVHAYMPRFRASTEIGMAPPDGGAIYTMTNQPENEVIVYYTDPSDGTLTFSHRVPTGGGGGQLLKDATTGNDIVGVSASSTLNVAGNCLLVANPGSGEISSFVIRQGRIEHPSVISSGGIFPTSIAVKDELVYVVNGGNFGGDPGSLQAFTLDRNGCTLTTHGDPVPLRQTVPDIPNAQGFTIGTASQVGFAPNGNLVVTIKLNGGITNMPPAGSVNVYELDDEGLTSDAALIQQSLITDNELFLPFSFLFNSEGLMYLAKASGTAGDVVVYDPMDDGTYEIKQRVNSFEAATCWLAYSSQTQCVWTTNTGSPLAIGESVSSFKAQDDGTLTLEEQVAAELQRPIDIWYTNAGYVYVLSNINLADNDLFPIEGVPSISVFEAGDDCSLAEVQVITDGFDFVPNAAFRGAGGGVEVGLAYWEQS